MKGKGRGKQGDVGKVFSVHPRCSTAPLLSDLVKRHGLMRSMDGFNGWSDCREVWIHQVEAVPINPFCAPMVNPSIMLEDKERNEEDAVEDFVFGHGCVLGDHDWEVFCREVLLLEHPLLQTLDSVVEMVDEMIVYIVRAVAGCEDFASGPKSGLMRLVVMLVRLLLLCGGSGSFPREYAIARFGGIDPSVAGGPFPSHNGRGFAHKLVRRMVSLGRCVRGIIRVAWDHSVWRDPELMGLLGLEVGGGHSFSVVWRAAVGVGSPLALFMENVIGPSYVVDDTWGGGYIAHEYFSSTWRPGDMLMPMSSETIAGSVVPMMVYQGGRYADFGGVDRQYQIFLHNLHWGFMHQSKYTEVEGSARFPVDLLAVFGIKVGGAGVASREFHVANARCWLVGGGECLDEFGEKQDEVVMGRFLMPLRVSDVPGVAEEDARARRGVNRGAMLMRMMTEGHGFMSLVVGVSLEE